DGVVQRVGSLVADAPNLMVDLGLECVEGLDVHPAPAGSGVRVEGSQESVVGAVGGVVDAVEVSPGNVDTQLLAALLIHSVLDEGGSGADGLGGLEHGE